MLKVFYKVSFLRKTICLFVVLCTAIVFCLFMEGCDNNKLDDMDSDYKVVYEDVSYDWNMNHVNFIEGCDSLTGLKTICKNNDFGAFDKNVADYDSAFAVKIREYNKDFFKRRSLVVCSITESYYSGVLEVGSVSVERDTLVVKIRRNETDSVNDVIVGWGFVIELDKSFVSAVAYYKYIFD